MQPIIFFLKRHWKRVAIIIVVLFLVVSSIIRKNNERPTWVTETVSRGTVSHIISVSGTMNATQSAELSFPATGILESLSVKEGDVVEKGATLATLRYSDLSAEYRDAEAALQIAQADYRELISGLRPEERDITKTKVQIAEEELARVIKEQDDRVENARRALLSSNLEARPVKSDNDDTPPTITGAYMCEEGVYTMTIFRSGSKSGYSYRLSGLEGGTYSAFTESSVPMGTCGLSIQFADGESYGNSEWLIEVPNPRGASYVANRNAYTLAQTERTNAIRTAEQNLELARQNATLDTADPRLESRTREEARILQAQARVEKIASQIRDRILTAPFSGTVTAIEPVPGETIGGEPVVTLVSRDVFELTALIPEIDVTKVAIGKNAHIVFDARPNETLPATIAFISPLAKEIGGVSYFETKLYLDTPTDWLQSGLNADIDITIESREGVLRIPKRFLVNEHGAHSVLVPDGEKTKSIAVDVVFEGNDGFAEITGLEEGTTVIAP